MAKKSVIIFDGEDKFINPKKAVYSKTRGQSKKFESFKSLRASLQDEEGPTQSSSEQVADSASNSGSMYTAPAVEAQPSSGGSSYVPESPSQFYIPNINPREPIAEGPLPVIDSPAELLNRFSPAPSVEDDRKTTMPIYEAPPQFISQPITQEPPYVAPVPALPTNPRLDDEFRKTIMPVYEGPVQARFDPITQEPVFSAPPIKTLPTRPQPPSDIMFPDDGSGYRGGKAPILDDRLPSDGIPQGAPIFTPSPYQPNPIYTAPVPILPTPPRAKIIADPMGGGGSPVMGGPEIPNIPCPPNFYPSPNGNCLPNEPIIYDKPISSDPCQGLAKPQLAPPPAGMKWIRKPDCTHVLVKDESQVIPDAPLPATTSSTTSTTTKAPTTSTTTSTTTQAAVADKICNPPIYAAPKYYKWVSKGNCAYELVVDDTQLKDAAPAPVLPAAGQPIININYPTGGLGTIPLPTTSTSTTVQTTTLKPLATGGDSGGSGGGGGGSPFPEEPAPIGPAPKKNYFWWYVGGALAIYLLMKRKNKQ